jgi:hypothetical protein
MAQYVLDNSPAMLTVLNVLKDGNYCSSKVADKAKLSQAWASAIITKLLKSEKIHICDWEAIPPRNVQSRAVYKLGYGFNKEFLVKPKHNSDPLHIQEYYNSNFKEKEVKRCFYVAALFGPTAMANKHN